MAPLVQPYRILIVGAPANAPITMHNDIWLLGGAQRYEGQIIFEYPSKQLQRELS